MAILTGSCIEKSRVTYFCSAIDNVTHWIGAARHKIGSVRHPLPDSSPPSFLFESTLATPCLEHLLPHTKL